MTMLARLLNPAESRSTLRDPDGWLIQSLTGGASTLSGQVVSPKNATGVSAYYGAMRAISEDEGKLPLPLFKRLKPRGKERRLDHWLYRLIHDEPNPEMSSQTFRETLTSHAMGWGGGYAEIERWRDRPVALWPLDPSTVRVEREGDSRMLVYKVRHNPQGSEVSVPARDIFHIHGLGFDGLTGYSVAKIAKQTLGLAMATEKYGASYFGRAGRPSGVLEHPATLKPERVPVLRNQFEEATAGEKAWHKTLVLEDGMTWKPYSFPHDDAQWIESRHLSIEEVARWFRIPPHKIQHLLRATFDNIAEQSIEYVVDTLLPWLKRWETEIWRKLIPRAEQATLFAEHVVEGLLRGDPKMQAEMFRTGRQWGYLSANDVRNLLNMNPIGEQGDVYLSPENMAPATTLTIAMPGQDKPDDEGATAVKALRLLQRGQEGGQGKDGKDGRDGKDGDKGDEGNEGAQGIKGELGPPGKDGKNVTRKVDVGALVAAHLPQMLKAYAAILDIEANKAERASKRSKLAEWASDFYVTDAERVRGGLTEPIEAFCGSLWAMHRDGNVPEPVSRAVSSYTAELVDSHVTRSRTELLDDVSRDVTAVLAEWRSERPKVQAGATLRHLTGVLHSILGIEDGNDG